MANRFAKRKRDTSVLRELLLPVALFLLVAGVCWAGMNALSRTADSEQLKSARQAVARAAVHCYAVEGQYPPSLGYLEQHYGLSVDTDKYIVDYRCFASNIMPDITVLPRRAAE